MLDGLTLACGLAATLWCVGLGAGFIGLAVAIWRDGA